MECKKSKNKNLIKHDLAVSMKAVKIEWQRAKMHKQLLVEKKRAEKDIMKSKIFSRMLMSKMML